METTAERRRRGRRGTRAPNAHILRAEGESVEVAFVRNEGRVDHKLDADMRHRASGTLADAELKKTLSDGPLPLEEGGRLMEDRVRSVMKSNPSRNRRFHFIDGEAGHRSEIRQHGSESERWIFG